MEAHALREQGWTISAIARHLGHDRKTVRAYLSGARVPEVRVRREPTLAEPFWTVPAVADTVVGCR